MLYKTLIIIEVVCSIALVLLILLQQGKGADAGAAFGSGASGTVFGSRGSASVIGKLTAVLAFVFMANSTAMAYLSHQTKAPQSAVVQAAQSQAAGDEKATDHSTVGESNEPGQGKTADHNGGS